MPNWTLQPADLAEWAGLQDALRFELASKGPPRENLASWGQPPKPEEIQEVVEEHGQAKFVLIARAPDGNYTQRTFKVADDETPQSGSNMLEAAGQVVGSQAEALGKIADANVKALSQVQTHSLRTMERMSEERADLFDRLVEAHDRRVEAELARGQEEREWLRGELEHAEERNAMAEAMVEQIGPAVAAQVPNLFAHIVKRLGANLTPSD